MSESDPLLLVTNDDGIRSPGLRAAAEAVLPLGEVLVVAPCRQWSGASRSFPIFAKRSIERHSLQVAGAELEAFCVDAAPAQVVLHAMLKLTPRRPALVVVGINFGENLGADATISGTVGAALQGAASGIPALAVSLQTPKETHTQISDAIDFSVAAHFTRRLARMVLQATLPYDVDVLKIDIPDSATAQTEWRLTRVSRQTYFRPHRPERTAEHAPAGLDYDAGWDLEELERDTDIYALAVDRVVSVSPLSIDLTSRVELAEVARSLDAPELY